MCVEKGYLFYLLFLLFMMKQYYNTFQTSGTTLRALQLLRMNKTQWGAGPLCHHGIAGAVGAAH